MKCTVLLAVAALLAPLALAEKTAPKATRCPSPNYPEELTDSDANGSAQVDSVVKADGSVAEPKLAMAAIVRWRFEPGTQDGVPIDGGGGDFGGGGGWPD